MREYAYEYEVYSCEECGYSHSSTIVLNVEDGVDPEYGEGLAYHELIRSCSPEDCDLVSITPTGNPPHRYNKVVRRGS